VELIVLNLLCFISFGGDRTNNKCMDGAAEVRPLFRVVLKKNVIFEGGTHESSECEHHSNLVSDYQRY
jgi:hypothetical protein